MGVITRALEQAISGAKQAAKPAAAPVNKAEELAKQIVKRPEVTRPKSTAETIIEMEQLTKEGKGPTIDWGSPYEGTELTPGQALPKLKDTFGSIGLDDVMTGVFGDDWRKFRRVGIEPDNHGVAIKGTDGDITTKVYINPKRKTVTHELTTIPRNQQGVGRMRPILKSRLDLYEKMGMERVELIAGLDTGPYAWLRYGFVPKYPNELAETAISSVTRQARKAMGKEDDWDVVEELADLDAMAKELKGNKFINQLLIEHAKNMPKTGKLLGVPPGTSVLKSPYLETTWEGYLDLKDPEQMSIVKEYIR